MIAHRLLVLAFAVALAAGARSQELSEERVRDVLEYLSSDRLAGRDSPSPALEEAALFLAWSFAKAGLAPGAVRAGEPGWFHHYTLDGAALDTAGSALTLRSGDSVRELVPEVDFRLWDAGRAFSGEDLPLADEPAAAEADPRRRRREMAGRVPRFLRLPADDPAWAAAAQGRTVLRRRAPGAAPTVLLRADAVPADARVDLRVPAPREVDVPLRNVVGLLRGTDLADEFVLVTAHYDHVGVRPGRDGGDSIYNGADDNATGTTAVVVLAEHLAAQAERPRRSLLFVCFSAEEKGLRGSRAFVEDPPIPLDSIAAVVNLEMLGRPEADRAPYAWITGKEHSDLAAIAAPAFERAGVEFVDFGMAARLYAASDNYPFAQRGVVAHSFSAGTLHEDYHQPGDEAGKIDVPHMTAVIGGLAEVVTELANRDERPQPTKR